MEWLVLVLAAILVGGFLRAKGWHSPLVLIVVGVALGVPAVSVVGVPDPEAVLALVLPPVVFAAGLRTSIVDLRGTGRSVIALAIGLVVITTLAIGGVALPLAPALSFGAACALGAILAPTDAVAAAGVAERVGLSRRVRLIIEGESLANDGTALTALRVAVVAAVATITVGEAAGILLLAAGVGIALGCAFGLGVSRLLKHVRQPVVGNALLLLTPFAAYELTEVIGGSGLLAVALAGVWIAHTTYSGHAFETRIQANAVWSLVTFVLESSAFVFLGVELVDTLEQVGAPGVGTAAILIAAVFLAMTLTRGCFMVVWYLLSRTTERGRRIGRKSAARQYAAVSVLGVRGPVSVLAAFSLPLDVPGRALILTVTFGVVIVSLSCSLLAPWMVRALGVAAGDQTRAFTKARKRMAQAALQRLDQLVSESDAQGTPVSEVLVSRLRSLALRRIEMMEGSTGTIQIAVSQAAMQRNIQKSMIHAERRELATMRDDEGMPGDVARKMMDELDLREAALGAGGRA